MDTELAWASGFFDGEGCTYCRNGGRKFGACLKQNDLRPLQRFVSAVGAGKIYGPYSRNQGNPYFEWHVHGKAARDVFERLYPYLSAPKREQGERCLAIFSEVDIQRRERQSGPCAFEACERDALKRGLCNMHYKRMNRQVRRSSPPALAT